MTYEEELSDPTRLAPDEAFTIVGNETRIQILQTLGEADEPLVFSELYDRVEYDTTANFNYHLDQLMAHFVRKGEDGYELRHAGRKVVQGILSGAVTNATVVEPTRSKQSCPYCGAPIEVRYHQGHIEQFCTECAGSFERDDSAQLGYLGCLMLPPAGLEGRTTDEAVRTAWTWMQLKMLAIANGICPNCSARLEREVNACEDHDSTEGLCNRCDRRSAVAVHFSCTNCIYDGEGDILVYLAANTALLAFLTAHGLNPVAPTQLSQLRGYLSNYDEVVRSTDPFEAEFTFAIDGDTLTLTVDDELSVVDVTNHPMAETV
jgi:hypothetical protein